MSSLIPTHATKHIVAGLSEYLATSFSLAEQATATGLKEFLTDPEAGMFHGPYVRTRLPYAPAEGWENILSWLPEGFQPYRHQAQAFERLASSANGEARRPEPTLVVTGTGSGKTESFLYPILDHCRRSSSNGIKALILYPMNALANDQAHRLAQSICNDPALTHVRAGIYTGEQRDSHRTTVSEAGLITDRETLRQAPPDILLTNYKMLDQLLLRDEDHQIWEQSAATLQYLVLDEFHTYDGAQGTDVALLLRRMGLKIKSLLPQDFLDSESDQRPLGQITPVATSATLGDKHKAPTEMLDFAHTIFGEELGSDAVVRETILDIPQWQQLISDFVQVDSPRTASPTVEDIIEINELIAEASTGNERPDHDRIVHSVFCAKLFECDQDLDSAISAAAHNDLIVRLLEETASPIAFTAPKDQEESDSTTSLVDRFFKVDELRRLGKNAEEFLAHALSEIAHLRAEFGAAHGWHGKKFPGVETHLWVREVSRIDRQVELDVRGAEMFRWSDNGTSTGHWLPACYCRNCGRSGWMTSMQPGDELIETSPKKIRSGSLRNRSRQRPLIDASSETHSGHNRNEDGTSVLAWLDLPNARLTTTAPDVDAEDAGGVVPVLAYNDDNADDLAKADTCPSCGEADAIRFLGSSVAVLLSVAVSNLFGMDDLDSSEKKSLVFTDSVQDAAHRAGFMQSRARAFAVRARTRSVVTKPIHLSELPDLLINSADRDDSRNRARFELLPPWVSENRRFQGFWDPTLRSDRHAAEKLLRPVLELDSALEFGDRSDLSRSLVSTGTLSVCVDVTEEQLGAILAELPLLSLGDANSHAWIRGILEYMRVSGGIYTDLLKDFIRHGGNTYMLHRPQAAAKGIPKFPIGGAPHFPALINQGTSKKRFDDAVIPLASARGWYARWTARQLGIETQQAGHLVKTLFQQLAKNNVVEEHHTESGGTIYALATSKILITPETNDYILECSVCNRRLGVDPHSQQIMSGMRCYSLGCQGHYQPSANPPNYYRELYNSRDSRTVIAREHTGLLEAEERLEVEKQFKDTSSDQAPNAPNVLVATPTLEMGIDIGDLSTVLLASLPDSVSSYVQRVGRAGRLTGNSLVIAVIRGRGKALARLNKPLDTIDGEVQPPAAFLSAREILRRQFTAYVLDSMNLSEAGVFALRADSVFDHTKGHTVISAMQQRIKEGVDELLQRFLAVLTPFISESVTEDLRAWVKDEFSSVLTHTQQEWFDGRRVLRERNRELGAALEDLEKQAAANSADDEVEQRLRATRAAYKFIKRQIATTYEDEYWIASMERYGLLPNFTLLDDTVEFHLSITRTDATSGEMETSPREYSRGISSALYELAPDATFYVQGIAATIDSVELGPENSALQSWRLCPRCSYSEVERTDDPRRTCPACGEQRFADRAQVLNVVEMTKVYASVDYSLSAITDSRDDRSSVRFETALSMVVPSHRHSHSKAWYLKNTGFGVEYLSAVELRWLNLGRATGGAKQTLVGTEVEAPLFRVCRECGHKDSEAGSNRWQDHKPWCRLRNAVEEDTVEFALGRRLETQGVLMHLPLTIAAADDNAVPSLIAAMRMGFKLALGGNPDHLDVAPVYASSQGNVTQKLLLHDSIPGGTGYLSQFTSPAEIRRLLSKAFSELQECDCQNDDRLACPHCLLPFTTAAAVERTSRESALAALSKILLDDTHPSVSTDPVSADYWEGSITEKEPKISERSQLEAEFLELLRRDLKKLGAHVKEQTIGNNARWIIQFHGSHLEWTMDEQKDFGFTRPDFYFETDSATVDNIAVYLDGAQYHASSFNNSVASDIDKRNRLRNRGIQPWSMTMKDLKSRVETAKGIKPEPPQWFAPQFRSQINKMLTMDDSMHEILLKDPMSQLLEILRNPTSAWTNLGNAAATHGLLKQRDFGENYGRSIDLSPIGDKAVLTFTIEDGIPHQESWEKFLQLSNLLYLSEKTTIGVQDTSLPQVSAVENSNIGEPKSGASDNKTASPWGELLANWDDDEEVVRAFHALADSHVALPDENGEEILGLSTIATWKNQKVLLVYEGESVDFVNLKDDGWAIIETSDVVDNPQSAIPETLKQK